MSEPFVAQPAYRIETRRLLVRCYEPGDAPAVLEATARNFEHLREWLPWADEVGQTVDDKLTLVRGFRANFDQGRDFVYGVFDPADGELVGGTGLHTRVGPGGLEIGYWTDLERGGRGYATELAAVLSRVALECLGMDRVEIHVHPDNRRSRRIPEKLGFRLEGRLRRRLTTLEGPREDKLVFTLLADELDGSECPKFPYRAFDALGRPL